MERKNQQICVTSLLQQPMQCTEMDDQVLITQWHGGIITEEPFGNIKKEEDNKWREKKTDL